VGVVVGLVTEPENPLADVTPTDVTVPPVPLEIAPVVVWTVTPFCTIGTSSVPVNEPAVGSWVMVICADIMGS
jgi:hypothetical protein